jgi:hypothetical protein
MAHSRRLYKSFGVKGLNHYCAQNEKYTLHSYCKRLLRGANLTFVVVSQSEVGLFDAYDHYLIYYS